MREDTIGIFIMLPRQVVCSGLFAIFCLNFWLASEGRGTQSRTPPLHISQTLNPEPRTLNPEPCFSGYRLDLVPNDPFYFNNGNIRTDFQRWVFDGIEADRNLNAETGWGLTTGNSDVVIAVIDSGVWLEHPDLKENLWRNIGEIPANQVDDDQNGFIDDVNGWDFIENTPDPNPDLGNGRDDDGNGLADENTAHGTIVAGVIGARGNNRTGIAGTTWRCQLMPLKVARDDGSVSEDALAAAIRYAAKNGAQILNLSLSQATVGAAVREAIEFAQAQGALVIASAGDENTDSPRFPARLPGVIAVGATDSGFRGAPRGFNGSAIAERAFFSSFGPAAVDVVAPGFALSTSVLSVFDAMSGSGNPGTPVYAFSAGTSIATGYVSGLAALIVAQAKTQNLVLTAAEIRYLIVTATQELPDDPDDKPDAGKTWAARGRVDFVKALNAVPTRGVLPLIRTVAFDAGRRRLTVQGDNFPEADAVVTLDGAPLPRENHRYRTLSSGIARKLIVTNVDPNRLPAGRSVQIAVRRVSTGQTSALFTFTR